MLHLSIIRFWNNLQQWWQHLWQPYDFQPGHPRFQSPETQLPHFVRHCSVGLKYHRLFHAIRWQDFPAKPLTETQFHAAIPPASFAAACLIKLHEGLPSMPRLRDYLIEHPSLIWLLGLPLTPAPNTPCGFDPEASMPTARHLTRLLRKMPNDSLQFLLDETVRLIQAQLDPVAPDFGQAISLDTKHILAWVKENNPKAFVEDRYNKTKQPAGDPDCKLGCKKRRNQSPTPTSNPQPASQTDVGEFHWGYASGVVATKVPEWGEFVLAEFTQTFDQSDVSYFFPLMTTTERRLGCRPRFGALDAAYDAFYIYEYFHQPDTDWQTAFAAVPYNQRNGTRKTFDPDGHPHCEAGLVMTLGYQFTSRATLYEHQRDHYVCPLKGQGEEACPIQHKRWAKGGCTMRLPSSVGSRLRHQIDRDSDLYQAVYNQRTATERINAQAVALGIERPHLRNRAAITNQNTLIYVLINLRGWQRIRARQRAAENIAF